MFFLVCMCFCVFVRVLFFFSFVFLAGCFVSGVFYMLYYLKADVLFCGLVLANGSYAVVLLWYAQPLSVRVVAGR